MDTTEETTTTTAIPPSSDNKASSVVVVVDNVAAATTKTKTGTTNNSTGSSNNNNSTLVDMVSEQIVVTSAGSKLKVLSTKAAPAPLPELLQDPPPVDACERKGRFLVWPSVAQEMQEKVADQISKDKEKVAAKQEQEPKNPNTNDKK